MSPKPQQEKFTKKEKRTRNKENNQTKNRTRKVLGICIIKYFLKEKKKKSYITRADKNPSKITTTDFPGGAVVKNPPATARDMGSSPGPGRSHMPWSNKTRAPQLLSPRATTTEAHTSRARLRNKRSHRNEKPMHCNKE